MLLVVSEAIGAGMGRLARLVWGEAERLPWTMTDETCRPAVPGRLCRYAHAAKHNTRRMFVAPLLLCRPLASTTGTMAEARLGAMPRRKMTCPKTKNSRLSHQSAAGNPLQERGP